MTLDVLLVLTMLRLERGKRTVAGSGFTIAHTLKAIDFINFQCDQASGRNGNTVLCFLLMSAASLLMTAAQGFHVREIVL